MPDLEILLAMLIGFVRYWPEHVGRCDTDQNDSVPAVCVDMKSIELWLEYYFLAGCTSGDYNLASVRTVPVLEPLAGGMECSSSAVERLLAAHTGQGEEEEERIELEVEQQHSSLFED